MLRAVDTDARWAAHMPRLYDELLGPVLFAPFAPELAGRAAALQPARVLELAAGTGVVTAELVRRLPAAAVTATDLNEAMVAHGAERVPGATWRPADAQALPFPAGSVDLVVCSFGAMFFPDRPGAYAECARVLAAGGAVLLSIWDDVAGSPLTAALMTALGEVLPERTPDFPVRVPHGYADPARIRADLARGGLPHAEVERVVLRGRAPSARSVAEGFCLGTPLRFELERRDDLGALTAAVADRMTAALGDGPVEGDLAAFVVTARPGQPPADHPDQ
jgi:SAM-dependent methyltransferase